MDPYFGEYLNQLSLQLNELKKIVNETPSEALDWTPDAGFNSLAVLAAHSAGATNFLVGDAVSGRPSNRDRDREFATQAVTAQSLGELLDAALIAAGEALESLTLEDLHGSRFVVRQNRERTVAWLLLHALDHAAQHVGHAQVTRQLYEAQHS